MGFTVTWHDRFAEPKMASNPRYPDGIDLDATGGQEPACSVSLPYPAKRMGYYSVVCETCGYSVACTTAGRPDDPRSIKLPCQGVARH